MLGNPIFYHQFIRKATVTFGTIFNDIYVVKRDSSFNEVERIKVPLSYGPKEKFMVRMRQDYDLDKDVAIQLPRMSFELENIEFDISRKIAPVRKASCAVDSDTKLSQYVPTPYNVNFGLYLYTKHQDDAHQVVEQIAAFFRPEFTITINSIPELGLKDDISVILNSTSHQDLYEEQIPDRRLLIWEFKFTAKTWAYGPIQSQGVIKKAQTDFLIPPSNPGPITDEDIANTPRSMRSIIEPDPPTATAEDDYGITVTIFEFDDGLKYNPTTGNDEEIT